MRAVVQAAAFFELADNETLDPDVAVKELESMAFLLRHLLPEDKDELVAFVRREAEGAQNSHYRDFLSGFPEASGLIDPPGRAGRSRTPLPPLAVVLSFVDGINRGDVGRLASLMTTDHELRVFDEPPLEGKQANVAAWRGYFSAFPRYVIHPHTLVADHAEVVVLGHTTGSHLGLPDEQERELTLLWRAVVTGGRLMLWQLIEDSPARRAALRLPL
jgi:hypothetical protein